MTIVSIEYVKRCGRRGELSEAGIQLLLLPPSLPCQMHQVYTTGHPGISGMDQKLACKTCIVGNTQKATPFLSGLGEHFTKAIKENIILLNSLRQKHAYNQVQ